MAQQKVFRQTTNLAGERAVHQIQVRERVQIPQEEHARTRWLGYHELLYGEPTQASPVLDPLWYNRLEHCSLRWNFRRVWTPTPIRDLEQVL